MFDCSEPCYFPDESGEAIGHNDEEEEEDGSDYPVESSSFSSCETIRVTGVANQDAVMWSTDEPAGRSDGFDVLDGERQAGCEAVGRLACGALYHFQLDGTFY